jgi:hypothetical protein
MKPRTAHLLILALVVLVPAGYGAWLAIVSDASGSFASGIGVAVGLGIVLACLTYALISSLLVWRLADTARRVVLVHAALIGVAAAAFFMPRVLMVLF